MRPPRDRWPSDHEAEGHAPRGEPAMMSFLMGLCALTTFGLLLATINMHKLT